MSHSPSGAQPTEDAKADYLAAWGAINRLIRQGFSWSGHERNVALRNTGGVFGDTSSWWGFDWDDDARAMVMLDWDFDGDLDLALTNRSGPRLRLVENRLEQLQDDVRFVALAPRGTQSNPDGIGARIRVSLDGGLAGPRTLLRARRAGEGFLSQNGRWLHFGLGGRAVSDEQLVEVEVEWPGGARESFTGVEPNGFFELVEGSGHARRFETPAGSLAQLEGPTSTERPTDTPTEKQAARGSSRVVLAAPVALPTLRLERSDGKPGTLFGLEAGGRGTGTGRPIVLHLFASWCAPCIEELAASQQAALDWQAAGVVRVALSADLTGPEREAARALLEQVGWTSVWGFARAESLSVLDALHGALLDTETRLPLPATFLIDGQGRLVALYRGVVEPATLFADLDLVSEQLAERTRLARAVPFGGIWRAQSFAPDWAYLESFALKRGLPMTAREYHRARFEVLTTSAAEVHYRIGRLHAEQGEFELAVEAFRQAHESDPYSFAAWHDMGRALHFSDRFREAVVAYDRALQLAPDHAETLSERILALTALDQREAVQGDLARLRALNLEMAVDLERRIADHLASPDAPDAPEQPDTTDAPEASDDTDQGTQL